MMHTSRIAHACWSASAALALAGTALGQGAVVAPATPPEPPTPIHSFTSVSSTWSMTQSVDGRTISVSSKDGKVSADVDGTPVPANRIIQKDGSVRINDEKGESIFETAVPGSEPIVRAGPVTFPNTPGSLGGLTTRGGRITFANPGDRTVHMSMDVPKVMVGVQLVEPDSSLRGHLGLKENETTLISAVYEGLAAAQAGLEPYDIVVAINGKPPASPELVRKSLRETEPGKSIALDVIHRGVKKTVTITVEKYDEQKLEGAKINSIAASASSPSAVAIAGDPNDPGAAASWGLGGSRHPFVATVPGAPGQPSKSITFWGRAGADQQEEMAKRLQELAERDRLREQAMGGAAGQHMMDLNRVMDERMKKMEEMMQRMMEQRNTIPVPAPKKDEPKS